MSTRKENKLTTKSIKDLFLKILGRHDTQGVITEAPSEEVIENLIEKALGEKAGTVKPVRQVKSDEAVSEAIPSEEEAGSEEVARSDEPVESDETSNFNEIAIGEKGSTGEAENAVCEQPEGEAGEEKANESSCPYILKRNIVASLQEIRKFAEEHNLASAMIKALLTLLAEMAIDALKGKVSGTVLAILLNAMNFDKARSEAYREGEIAGRNAQIIEKHFPSTDDGLPHLASGPSPESVKEDIFSIARNA